ncbi:MAG: NAD-dependent epimerase/dehydratase family protein, partial [Epsilonproteobacteria bacterium]|nr:NAD-dependent epimerase/dehydratase family protein [Campylobacterota bacterium]
MKILVTGSSGYLGSSFINQYKERYNFSSFSLLKNAIEEIDFNGINTILHCAALVHQKNEHDYNKYYETNVEYPMKLANRAKKEGIEHFIFISTVAVYGDDLTLIDENSKTNPVSPYGRSKLLAEQKLSQLQDETFQVSIIRIPMIYGMDAPGNISSLIRV